MHSDLEGMRKEIIFLTELSLSFIYTSVMPVPCNCVSQLCGQSRIKVEWGWSVYFSGTFKLYSAITPYFGCMFYHWIHCYILQTVIGWNKWNVCVCVCERVTAVTATIPSPGYFCSWIYMIRSETWTHGLRSSVNFVRRDETKYIHRWVFSWRKQDEDEINTLKHWLWWN